MRYWGPGRTLDIFGKPRVDIGVEISLYPFTTEYAPYIHALIGRLSGRGQFRIESSSMSTQIFGPYEELMPELTAAMRETFETAQARGHRAVLVMKVLGPLASP